MNENKIECPQCGKPFEKKAVNQKFCSSRCGEKYRRKHGAEPLVSLVFRCRECGRLVETEPEKGDKRTVFCCHSCEKKFWRHPHWEKSALTNHVSADAYFSYERASNEW